jgi:hypothetical protein
MTSPIKYVDTNPETTAMFRRLEQTRHSGGIRKTEAQIIGNTLTSCALAVARLADRGLCATASAVSEVSGLNRSTAGRWLAILANGRDDALIASYDATRNLCGDAAHRRAYHYRTGA